MGSESKTLVTLSSYCFSIMLMSVFFDVTDFSEAKLDKWPVLVAKVDGLQRDCSDVRGEAKLVKYTGLVAKDDRPQV